MWAPKKNVSDKENKEENLLPLLRKIDPNCKLVISSVTGPEVFRKRDRVDRVSLAISFLLGTTSLILSILLWRNSLYNWILDDILEMRSLSPIYQIWKEPPHMVTFSVNIFEALNGEEFLASDDPNAKLELRDIGPVTYREFIRHENIIRNDNGTLSFDTVRRVEFLESQNVPGILNRTITVPNFGLIGALSFLAHIPYWSKLAFNLLLSSKNEPIFKNITVYDFLWNYQNEVIKVANKILPILVPVSNIGIMHRIYEKPMDHVSVRIGRENGHEKFFDMVDYNYKTVVPGFSSAREECNTTVAGANEAYLMSHRMSNKTMIKYLRKTVCHLVKLEYGGTDELQGLRVNKYVFRPESYRREANLSEDCYKGSDVEHILPDGLVDMSRCYFNFPMVSSLPHFLGYEDSYWNQRLSGISPDPAKHESQIFAESTLGIGMREQARSQFNVYVRDLSGFPEIYQRFSGMIIPVAWVELIMNEVPTSVLLLLKFALNILPSIDVIIPVLFLLISIRSFVPLMTWIPFNYKPSRMFIKSN